MQENSAKFKFQVEKIASRATDGAQCAVFSKNISLPDGTNGLFAGCIEAFGQEAELQGLPNKIFESACKVMEEVEDETLPKLKKIEGLVASYQKEGTVKLDYVFCFFYKSACYVARQGDRVSLWVYEVSGNSEIDIQSGSGMLHEGQIYLVANKNCVELFDFSILSEPDVNLTEVIDGMATEISAQAEAVLGAVFVKVITESTEEEPSFAETSEGKEGMESDDGEDVPETAEVTAEADVTSIEAAGGEVAVSQEQVQETVEVEREEPVEKPPEGVASGKSIFSSLATLFGRLKRELLGVFRGDRQAVGSFRKKLVIVAVLIVMVLVASGGYSIWKGAEFKKSAQIAQHLQNASNKYKEGVAIIELNRDRAKQILIEAQNEVKLAAALDGNNEEAKRLAADIEAKLKETDVSGNVELATFAQIDGDAKSISFNGKNVVVTTADKSFSVDANGKVTEISDLNNVSSATVFDGKIFYTGSNGVFRQAISGGDPLEITASADAQDIGVFFGNVYLLKSSQVSKLVPIEDGYAAGTDYIDTEQSFSNDSRMAIDSKIWITSGESILKFNRGKREEFNIAGLSGKLGNLGPIYTDGTVDNLYIVDLANSALLIFDKDGNYKKALQSPDMNKVKDLVVNEAEDTVYLAVRNTVLRASLK